MKTFLQRLEDILNAETKHMAKGYFNSVCFTEQFTLLVDVDDIVVMF